MRLIFQKYETFICYRRKEGQPFFAPSENVAGILHWWINCEKKYRNAYPALFEECYAPQGGLTYGERGIETFMPHMKTCFVVTCPEFFNKILEVYMDVLDEDRATADDDVFLQKVRTRLETDGGIYYLELKHALLQGCRLCPIHVSYNQRSLLSLNPKQIDRIIKVLGPGSECLFRMINSPVFNYDEISQKMQDFSWERSEKEDAAKLMQELDTLPEVQRLQQVLFDFWGESVKNTCNIDNLQQRICEDLKLCAMTINTRQKPGKSNSTFRATNPDIIYDPVRIHHDPKAKPPFLAHCLIDNFIEKNQKPFCLSSDQFRYWEVDFDTSNTQNDTTGISVCAVCFGTLSTYHRLRKDSILLEDGNLSDENKQSFIDTIDAGLNLLLALRNPYTKIWPSLWVFDNETIGVEGTINQTTLSLSTLMSCDFLSTQEHTAESEKYLKERYQYIWESADCLLQWGVTNWNYSGTPNISWRYTQDSEGATALLPTVFVFETFFKLQQCITKLLVFFQDVDQRFCEQLQKDLETLENVLTNILNYFENSQCNAVHVGAFKRFANNEYSVTHTAYVIKSLYQYIERGGKEAEKARPIAEAASDYLVNKVTAMMDANELTFEEWERFENFCSTEPDDEGLLKSTYGEQYEHCAELLLGEALIKIAENTTDKEFCNRVMQQLWWIFQTYAGEISKNIIRKNDNTLLIKGARSIPKYPIYYLYYYRMFLWDYLALLQKKGGETACIQQ